MDIDAVTRTYRRWAPVYDTTFGRLTRPGRRIATAHVNDRGGDVLEVGVGTGLALRHYADRVRVTGIDFSAEMLELARARVDGNALSNVVALRRMDARTLDFPDDSFDTVVAMYLISVVPDPDRVLAEMARVCRPDGEVVIVNHFAAESGAMARAEDMLGRFADRVGWHADFPIGMVTEAPSLVTIERRQIAPMGLFTFLRLSPRKIAAAQPIRSRLA